MVAVKLWQLNILSFIKAFQSRREIYSAHKKPTVNTFFLLQFYKHSIFPDLLNFQTFCKLEWWVALTPPLWNVGNSLALDRVISPGHWGMVFIVDMWYTFWSHAFKYSRCLKVVNNIFCYFNKIWYVRFSSKTNSVSALILWIVLP